MIYTQNDKSKYNRASNNNFVYKMMVNNGDDWGVAELYKCTLFHFFALNHILRVP